MRRISILLLFFFTCFALAAWPQGQAQWKSKIVTFDAPGAGSGSGQGTFGYGIVAGGAIGGYYIDSSNVSHGFVRTPDGTITEFDVPGAPEGLNTEFGTFYALNPSGDYVGFYYDSGGVSHGWVRAPNGQIQDFDATGAGTGSGQGTFSVGINPKKAITGWYVDSTNASHGFLRSLQGKYTTIDPKGSQGTICVSVTPSDEVAGFYFNANGVHGFSRSNRGEITSFDVTGAVGATFVNGNNPAGAITGYYLDSAGAAHGYLRLP